MGQALIPYKYSLRPLKVQQSRAQFTKLHLLEVKDIKNKTMKLIIPLLVLLAIMESKARSDPVESRSHDVINMSRDGKLNPPDRQAVLKRSSPDRRVKRKTGTWKQPFNVLKSSKPVHKTANIKAAVNTASQHARSFLSKLRLPKTHPAAAMFSSKFVDYVKRAWKGSSSARSTLASLSERLLNMGSQGASMAASIAQVLALTKQGSPVIIAKPEKDDLTPLLMALITADAKNGGPRCVVQSSSVISLLTLCVGRILSQSH